ncbi:FGGY-family carbohydrate kinase [Lichenicoccus sp.]|uniref:FGGY-family carbohydrate kinase n=1 Tax=Lichenicoccus sp. TaxID=2781899 RepID=UPI003D12121F
MPSRQGPFILAIDQGTSATKSALIDAAGRFVARGSAPLTERHPKPGWVEQDGREIWASVREAVRRCLDGVDARAVQAGAIVAVGLSTQRESVLLWDAATGEPVSPVISWQDQRGTELCDALRSDATEQLVRLRTGLPLDPMFSAVKASWLLDAHDPDRVRSKAGAIRLGTIDSWLLACLSGEHLIEAGNASRTQLLNVARVDWDDDLPALFGIPRACLPRIVASTGPFPATRGLGPLPDGTPLHAVMGDSHAALFGHGALAPGQVKATYGTGSSVMGLLAHPSELQAGLCLTIGWMTDRPAYAAEGNIRSSGATLRWLASILDVEVPALVAMGLAAASDGVVLVPGFGGLGAPWWDRNAVGLLSNLTLGTSRAALARAALESVVNQVGDLVEAIAHSVGEVSTLFVDGGPMRSDGLVQMQADRIGRPVLRASEPELSALGVAHLAGLAGGLWSREDLEALPRPRDRFEPGSESPASRERVRQWYDAVARAGSRAVREIGPKEIAR